MSFNLDRFFLKRSDRPYQGELAKDLLLLRASLYTGLFSLFYLFVSILIGFQAGVNLMIFNVVGFLLLPFLLRTSVPIWVIGNIYVFIGALAIVLLIYYSGGVESAILPWLLGPPSIAMLIVNKRSALVWAALMVACFFYFGILATNGISLEKPYDPSWHYTFLLATHIGLLLILVMIFFIFENYRSMAQKKIEQQNTELQNALQRLEAAKEELLSQNDHIKSQNEEIAAQTEFLKQLLEGKDYIIHILAHDLKSPLDSLEGLIILMKMEKVTSSQDEYLGLMQSSINKSRALIDKVINLGALEHQEQVNLTEESIYPILEKVVADFKKLAELKEINLQVEAADKQVKTLIDPIYLNQVYENILSNAIKFSPTGKDVNVRLLHNATVVRTEISDQGPGVPKEEMDRLFSKFSKLSAQPTAGESSTGLGLSLVKRYVELMNGKVWCESIEGQGATFIVEIPLTSSNV